MIDRLHNIAFVIVTIAILLNDGYLPNPMFLVMEAFDMPAWRALCVVYGTIFCSKYLWRYVLTGK
mgnify:CR=1 FL=1|jgi:hypothetical protein